MGGDVPPLWGHRRGCSKSYAKAAVRKRSSAQMLDARRKINGLTVAETDCQIQSIGNAFAH